MTAKPAPSIRQFATVVLALFLATANTAFAATIKDFSATTKDGKLLVTAKADASTTWNNSSC